MSRPYRSRWILRGPAPYRRSGLITVCVLVCLAVVVALAVSAAGDALRSRRELVVQHQMLQTEFLLDAGVRRAVSQLRQSSEYRGETWRPEAAIAAFPHAEVKIRISTSGPTNRYDVDVVARLGSGSAKPHRADASATQLSHHFQFLTSSPPPQE